MKDSILVRLTGRQEQTLLDVIRQNQVYILAPCSGEGVCGKCRVRVSAGADTLHSPTHEEKQFLSAADLQSGVRLACFARFGTDGSVTLAEIEEIFSVPSFDFEIPDYTFTNTEQPLVAAIDIGTTTIAVALFDRAQKSLLKVISSTNVLRSFGADVLSRIKYIDSDLTRMKNLQELLVHQLQQLIETLAVEAGHRLDELEKICVCANTTMLHFLTGENPAGLGCFPFRPVFLDARSYLPDQLGFSLPQDCKIDLLPGISAFVGADIVAGVLAINMQQSQAPELLIDVGTNGEMVLSANGVLYSTSTAAGPAFEGGHIECGCPGIPGAVNQVSWDGSEFAYHTIDEKRPIGFCGTGLIDCLAALLKAEVIDETGSLDLEDGSSDFFLDKDSAVYLTQKDIRQLQLAKGAMAAGIQVLCNNAGIEPETISRVYLAGGFGSFLKADSACAIGLFPASLIDRTLSIGNSALKGALHYALVESNSSVAVRIVAQSHSVDLSSDPDFQDEYVEQMLFPEGDYVLS